MPILKTFFLNTKKQIVTLLIYMIIFITLVVLFAQNGKQQRETVFESSRLTMIIQDLDESQLSRGLASYLSGEHDVKKGEYSEEEIADELYYENIDYVLTIPKGFEEKLTRGKMENILTNRKRQGSTSGYFLDQQIDQYVSLLSTYLIAGYTPADATVNAQKTAEVKPEVTFSQTTSDHSNKNLYYAFCYMPYILICILMSGLGMILITFQKENLNTRIQCSSYSATKRNLWLALGSIIFSILCWVLFLLTDYILLQANFFTLEGGLYILNSFVFLLVAMSITLLFSFLVHTSNVLNMMANIVGLGLSFLGGIFVPLEYMNSSVLLFSRLLPSYWYTLAMEKTENYTGKVSELHSIFSCVGMEALFALAIFCAALVIARQKKKR